MDSIDAERVAALYDIHGNLPALDAALAAADAAGADTIVIGGDVVLGPMPGETLDRLLALGPRVRFIRGNCDRLVVDAFDGRPLTPLPPAVQEPIVWAAGRLDRRQRDFLAALPETLGARLPRLGEVLFCHASPRNDEEIFTVRSPAERVRPMLDGVTQPVVVCGHTHMQFDRRVDGVRLINAGSVGMPFGSAAAYWLLLDREARLIRTGYDLERAAALVRRTGYPQVEAFLSPYTEEQALSLFEPTGPAQAPPS
jgi:putative phosphoesterase